MYRINGSENTMVQIKPVSLKQVGFEEVKNLQEWIVKHPECLCDDSDDNDKLLIIQKEFAGWDDQSRKRLDLLALDKQGNLVIIENKRDDSPYDVVAQAITYASFCETMTAKRIIEEYARYLNNDEKVAKEKICKFLGQQIEDTEDIDINEQQIEDTEDININRQQRIIIVAGDFPIEVTSAVLWLTNNYNLKIDCVCYHLYRDGEALYIDFDKIIPIAGTEDYQVKLAEKRREENESKSHKCVPEYKDYWMKVNSYLRSHNELVKKGFRPKDKWAMRGEQWFRFNISKKLYFFELRLSKRDGVVGVSVYIRTDIERRSNFYKQILKTPKIKQDIENALENEVVWGTGDPDKTISTSITWNREEPEKSIAWQMEKLSAVMEILDSVSK